MDEDSLQRHGRSVLAVLRQLPSMRARLAAREQADACRRAWHGQMTEAEYNFLLARIAEVMQGEEP